MINFDSHTPGKSNLPPELQAKIDALIEQPNATSNLDELNKSLSQVIESHNNAPNAEIGGFSPGELMALSRNEWDTPECPLKLSNDLSFDRLNDVSFFQSIRAFLITVLDSGGIRATAKGNLPRSFVTEMVDVFLDEKEKEQTLRVNKVLNEPDVFPLHQARILCELCGLISLTKKKFTLRKKTRVLLEPESAGQLYKVLFITLFRKYNIGYPYGGVDLDWLQNEIAYVLKPLQLNANAWIKMSAIAPKLLHPMHLERLEHELKLVSYMDVIDALERYFLRPLELWGLLEIERSKKDYFGDIKRIRKTPIFDQFIRFDF